MFLVDLFPSMISSFFFFRKCPGLGLPLEYHVDHGPGCELGNPETAVAADFFSKGLCGFKSLFFRCYGLFAGIYHFIFFQTVQQKLQMAWDFFFLPASPFCFHVVDLKKGWVLTKSIPGCGDGDWPWISVLTPIRFQQDGTKGRSWWSFWGVPSLHWSCVDLSGWLHDKLYIIIRI